MKVLIICVSKEHGNTQKIAESMTKALNALLLQPNEVNRGALEQYDLVGFGSGIRWCKHYKELIEFVAEMPRIEGKSAFIFSTSGFGAKWQHSALKKALVRKGLSIVGDFCCKGLDTIGPLRMFGGVNKKRPGQRDFEDADAFAADVLRSVSNS